MVKWLSLDDQGLDNNKWLLTSQLDMTGEPHTTLQLFIVYPVMLRTILIALFTITFHECYSRTPFVRAFHECTTTR